MPLQLRIESPLSLFHDGWTTSEACLHLSTGFSTVNWCGVIRRVLAAAERQSPKLPADVSPATLQNPDLFRSELVRHVDRSREIRLFAPPNSTQKFRRFVSVAVSPQVQVGWLVPSFLDCVGISRNGD
jgi:hypothetical protein